MPSIESAGIGDKLAVHNRNPNWGNAPHVKHAIFTVTRLTATQAVAVGVRSLTEKRFRRSDGAEINAIARYATPAEILTPELLAEHHAQTAALVRWRKATDRLEVVQDLIKRRELSVEQMEAIATAYEATLQPTGAPA